MVELILQWEVVELLRLRRIEDLSGDIEAREVRAERRPEDGLSVARGCEGENQQKRRDDDKRNCNEPHAMLRGCLIDDLPYSKTDMHSVFLADKSDSGPCSCSAYLGDSLLIFRGLVGSAKRYTTDSSFSKALSQRGSACSTELIAY